MTSGEAPWLLITLTVVAIESAVAAIIGITISYKIMRTAEGSGILLAFIAIAGGVVTGLAGVLIMGTEKGILFSVGVFAITGIGGMITATISGMLGRIIGVGLGRLITNDVIEEEPSEWKPGAVIPQKRETPPDKSEKPVIQQSLRRKNTQHKVAYISLLLALAEELIKAFMQDKPIFWAIPAAVLLILIFISQRVLTYRGKRDLYGASYREARETVTLISERRRKVHISQEIVVTRRELDNCLQTKTKPDDKLDKADKATSLAARILDIILLHNPTKTGLGVLLGVVIHTVLENIFDIIMRYPTSETHFNMIYYEIFSGLPVYFWIALSILLLNFRNLFVDSLKKSSLGILLGIVGYTVYENVVRFMDIELALPIYFWIAAGVLALNLLNLLFTPRIERELKIQMRYIKEAQKNGDFTPSEQRQQWRNFIALVNQKALQ